MSVKRPAGVEQALGHAERLRRRDRQIVGDALFPGLAAGEWAPGGVAGPGVAWPPGRVPVAGLADRIDSDGLAAAARGGSGFRLTGAGAAEGHRAG